MATSQEAFEKIKTQISEALKESLSVEGKNRKLVVDRITINDNLDPEDLKDQKEARLNKKTWGVPVYVSTRVIDKDTKETIAKKRLKVTEIPKLTPRDSFIINGTEFQITNQLRLKPGAYVRINTAGQTDQMVNLARGRNFNITLRGKDNIVAKFGTTNIKVYSLAKILGVDDEKLKDAVGEDIYKKLVTSKIGQDVTKLYKAIFRKQATSESAAIKELREYFQDTRMDPKVNDICRAPAQIQRASAGRGHPWPQD